MNEMEINKEFKVRIDMLQCSRYKTYQPELPTKKFLFSDESESIHNLKLLTEDSSEQNKTTSIHSDEKMGETKKKPKKKTLPKQQGESKEKETEEKETEENETDKETVIKAETGMFRDKKRRIDLVLVVEDDVDELMNNVKLDFLSYIVRAGLEVEIEPGVMQIHEHLTFIKIHAPYHVLEKYGRFLGTKRYFADTRYDYMGLTKSYDKEWVKLVRENYEPPFGFSNYERSIIVYKMLLHLSFGDNANYYGIERLLNRKIILDLFALHDGPYFITPYQTISGSNARQILNYYWSRLQNIFNQQPIHLIHEYFGPRLAFYFAFYEFFTKALIVAACLGIMNTYLGYLNIEKYEVGIRNSICKSSDVMCKSCDEGCPKRVCKEYCFSVYLHLILDHLLVPLYSLLTVCGSFIFLRLWQRREYFLKWIWEVGGSDSYYRNAVRPLFDSPYRTESDVFNGGFRCREHVIQIFLRNFISKTILITYWYTLLPMMHETNLLYESFVIYMRNDLNTSMYREYMILSIFQTFYITMTTVIEKIYHHIIYFLVKFENHSSHKQFNKSIIIKKIGFKMVYQYMLIGYYAWIYGHHARYARCDIRGASTEYQVMYVLENVYGYNRPDLCNRHRYCFPYSCGVEVGTLQVTLLIVTQVVYKMFHYIFYSRDDYNQRKYRNSDIPCWEREYRLSSWTDKDLVRKYVNLAFQFTLVTWFVISFPLGPLILYLMNVWDIRHEARKLLLASRRPLLIETPGTEMTYVFYFIASVAVLTNALNIAILTRTGLRYFMYKNDIKQGKLFQLYHHYYVKVLTQYYYCYGPDMITGQSGSVFIFYDTGTVKIYFKPEFYLFLAYRLNLFILTFWAMVVGIFIIRYTISRHRKVEILRAEEQRIKNLYYNYKYKHTNIQKNI